MSSLQLTSSGPLLNTISDAVQSVNEWIKSLIASPPWQPLNTFISGTATNQPSLQTVDTYLKQLTLRLPPPPLETATVTQLKQYCGIKGSCGSSMTLVGSSATPVVVPVGSPVVLTALAPLPGVSLPALPNFSAASLPASSNITFQWHISFATASTTGTTNAFKPGLSDARPGNTIDDAGGSFECVSGSLTSPLLEIMPWPDANHGTDPSSNVITPSTVNRTFAAYLDITFWWPGLPQTLVVSTDAIFFSVQSWNDVLTGTVDKTNKVWQWTPGTVDPANPSIDAHQFFGNLFDVAIDNAAPAAGQLVTATITRADYKPALPQVITTLVQRDPQLTIQAGLDVGAVLNKLSSVASLVTGSQASSIPTSASGLSVSKVLSDVLSIPIAVAVNGTDVAKTIIPNSPITLPNIVASPDGSSLSGIIPIGQLMTRINARLDDDSLNIAAVEGVLRKGLSFLPVPVFGSLKAELSANGPTVTVSVGLKADLLVPGASRPIALNFSVGSFTIRRPVIPIPQLALMFSDPLASNPNQDILFVPDPVTRSLFGGVDALKGLVGTLGDTLTTISNLAGAFPGLTTALPDFAGVSKTVSLMTEQLANAAANGKQLYMIGQYSNNATFSPHDGSVLSAELPVDRWWDGRNTDSLNNNISALLWIGAPDSSDYWMRLGLDDRKSPQGRMFLPPGTVSSVNSLRFLSPSDMSSSISFLDMSGNGFKVVDTNFGWNDKIRWVEFSVGGRANSDE